MFFVSFIDAQNTIISKINVKGNSRTKTSFIKKIAFVKTGSVLDSTKIHSDIRRLKLLASIANVDYTLKPTTQNSYTLTYIIEENFAIIPGLNISTDNNGDFAFRTSIFDFNFLGRNQLIGGFYSRNVFNSYGAYWEAPNLFTRKWGMGINYQSLTSQEPVFFENDNNVNYKFDNKAFEIKLQYEPNFHNRLELGANISKEDYSFIEGDLPSEISGELDARKITMIGEYEYNNINIFYQYKEGYRSILTYRFLLGSNGERDLLTNSFINSFIGNNDLEYFKRIGEKGNWANRFRLAYASNNKTPFAPFALDNQLNIRGVGNTIDRGTASIILNTEYRHTLYPIRLKYSKSLLPIKEFLMLFLG